MAIEKYKFTVKLIMKALGEAKMSQKDIAQICKVSESKVSDWKKGKYLARIEQIQPLIDEIGGIAEHCSWYSILPNFIEYNDELEKKIVPDGDSPGMLIPKLASFSSPFEKLEKEHSYNKKVFEALFNGFQKNDKVPTIRVIERIRKIAQTKHEFDDIQEFAGVFSFEMLRNSITHRLKSCELSKYKELQSIPIQTIRAHLNSFLTSLIYKFSEEIQVEGKVVFPWDGEDIQLKLHDLNDGTYSPVVSIIVRDSFLSEYERDSILNVLADQPKTLTLTFIDKSISLDDILKVLAKPKHFNIKRDFDSVFERYFLGEQQIEFGLKKALVDHGVYLKGVPILSAKTKRKYDK